MFPFGDTSKFLSCGEVWVGILPFPTPRGFTKRCATEPRRWSTGRPDHEDVTGERRGIARFWIKIGPRGVARGLRMFGDYSGRGIGLKLERSCSRPHQPG